MGKQATVQGRHREDEMQVQVLYFSRTPRTRGLQRGLERGPESGAGVGT